jgi:ribosome-associated protein
MEDPKPVTVREVPIELCQFIKFAGLTDTGGEAKYLISEGQVTVNSEIETRKRRKLQSGDMVTLNGHTIIVSVREGEA